MNRPRPRPSAAAAAMLLLAVLGGTAGCSTDDGGSPTRSPIDSSQTDATESGSAPAPSEPTSSEPALPLPEVSTTDLDEVTTRSRPVWSTDGDGPYEVTLLGDDLALVSTDDTQSGAEDVVDLTTGRVLWSGVYPGRRLPVPGDLTRSSGLVGGTTSAGPVVMTSYYADGCSFGCPVPEDTWDEQKGVLALDPRTGDIVWGRGLVGSAQSAFLGADRREDLRVRPVAVGDDVVVAEVGASGSAVFGTPDESGPAYAVGLDPATGDQLWATPDVVAQQVVGDVVLGYANDESSLAVVALDAASGAELWRTAESSFAAIISASPRVVLTQGPTNDFQLLDTATGDLLDQQLPEGTVSCAPWTGGDLDVACAWRSPTAAADPRLLTLDSEGTLSLSAAPMDRIPREITVGGVVLDTTIDGPASVLDAAGRELLTATDDLLITLDERYVVYGTGSGLGGYDSVTIRRRD